MEARSWKPDPTRSVAEEMSAFSCACFGVEEPGELPPWMLASVESAFFAGTLSGLKVGLGRDEDKALAVWNECIQYGQNVSARLEELLGPEEDDGGAV
ncbi:hypothetical protein [Poseidonocella sp. HB161398]|uniref:hypothetical protein n=1 Tax=Poseidonocella sp. HB161398 TaxID=2320855 RepID=UPI001108D207|nr:hypothetical protein [Poseidonocella sp. HB161398]